MAAQRDDNRDARADPKGEYGGDTGKTDQLGQGPGAEKGDQRRPKPVHSGPTRGGQAGTTNRRSKRSGSDSNASQ
ncbi:MAG: hypothetical protein ACTHMJ_06110 [Thermomicrobiales bacterium]|nr:hypothetical protein [Thermomicrobiales bacterium]